ncbi:MAG TPA: GrpB family protein [Pseudonocardiaceae bacterium]
MAHENSQHWPIWATETVRLIESQPAWADLAEDFIGEVQDLLGHWLSSDVLHVGSTAIPGLPAKPVIDLQALSQDPDTAIAGAHDALTARSWYFVPRHLDQQPWRWFIVRADPTGQHRLAHLHLMRPGQRRWHEQLAFRDRLRTKPALADEYTAVKTQAAADHPDNREAYTQAKAQFIRRVLTT